MGRKTVLDRDGNDPVWAFSTGNGGNDDRWGQPEQPKHDWEEDGNLVEEHQFCKNRVQ